jgi:hypothetical protein
MLATRTKSPAVFLVLALSLICSAPTFSQSPTLFYSAKSPAARTGSGAWLAKCQESSMDALVRGRLGEGSERSALESAIPGDSNLPSAGNALCAEPALASPPRPFADDPCASNVTRTPSVPGSPRSSACHDSADAVVAELSGLGKAGAKIARAREEVLDILRSGNACAEWFAAKDANPAETFRSLSFRVDKQGPQQIFESQLPEAIHVWRQPYVARATQDGGPYTTITINAYGAFYRAQGTVLKTVPEGGPFEAGGTRLLTVGSYPGDTLPARMATLLHEFGHIIDLLPGDADNLDGKSVRNTNEVLRHCQSEIQARSQASKANSEQRVRGQASSP